MTEYEKKQLELLVAQNKKFEKIEFGIVITVISLAIVVGFLTFLRLKKSSKHEQKHHG